MVKRRGGLGLVVSNLLPILTVRGMQRTLHLNGCCFCALSAPPSPAVRPQKWLVVFISRCRVSRRAATSNVNKQDTVHVNGYFHLYQKIILILFTHQSATQYQKSQDDEVTPFFFSTTWDLFLGHNFFFLKFAGFCISCSICWLFTRVLKWISSDWENKSWWI